MIGQTISHYKILEKLGEGGMGVVYKALDVNLDRPVALKFLPASLVRDPEAKKRFTHEAKAASALDHPNICTIHEIGEREDGQVFISMGYYEGETLQETIERGPLKLDQATDLAIQIAQGLLEAHQHQIVHRDIKPDNILITNSGLAKIVDFGLAKLSGQTKLTREGSAVGTVAYMSPEQARGEEADHRSDIWSLGAVLYEMVAGRPPFKGEYENAVIYAILNADPEPLTALRTDVPIELERIVMKALSKQPADRYQHVDEMIVDLRSIRQRSELGKAPLTSFRPTMPRRKRVIMGIGAFLAIAIAAILLFYPFRRGGGQTIRSLAVLPLSNFSGDADQEYFVDGMTEELIADLSQISAIRVISRTSVMQYRNTEKSIPEIVRELNVDAVIEGSVLRSGERVRVTAQLIQGATDQHLWANSYERELGDIFSLQSEVAKAIANEIKIRLTPREEATLASREQVDPDALEAFLKGRYYFNNDQDSLAVDWFKRSIDIDPTFAPPYAALANEYAYTGVFSGEDPRLYAALASAAAAKALELDPNQGEAHAALGFVKLYFDWDWPGAAEEFQKALQFSPGDVLTRHGYADYLLVMGRADEAVEQVKIGRAHDPMSPLANMFVRGHLFFARRYDEGEEELRKMRRSDVAPGISGWFRGQQEEFFEGFRKRWGSNPLYAAAMKRGYAELGPAGGIRAVAQELEKESKTKKLNPLDVAELYAFAQDTVHVLHWLEKAYEKHLPPILHIKATRLYDFLHGEPRFQDLLRRIGFPEDKQQ